MVNRPMHVIELKGGRVIDPANNRDEVADLWIVDGKVHTQRPEAPADEVFDVSGKLVTPGLIDMHVHLREPGREDCETIATGTRAAAAGGFTSVVPMANTDPVIDSQTGIKFVLSRSQTDAVVNVFPVAAVTRGQQGRELNELGDLLQAGAVAFSDDGHAIMNNQVMRRALEYARTFGALILDHCEDRNLVADGVLRESDLATRIGLPGWPAVAESVQVARDIDLAEFTGGRVHIHHVSTRASVGLIRAARKRGVRVSCEVTPHHLALTLDAAHEFDTRFKCSPPLGTDDDREALIRGLADGTIEVIATDHAPHTSMEKDLMFIDAPPGIIGMETAFGVLNEVLVRPGLLSMAQLIEKMTLGPARLLGLHKGTLTDRSDADVAVFDPELNWTVDPERFESKGANCPWNGHTLTGRAVLTFVGGRLIFRDGEMQI